MRGHWYVLLLLGCAQALHASMKPAPVKPTQPIWVDPPVAEYVIPKVEAPPTVSLRPKMERSLADCCGKRPTTFGPLFGDLDLGSAPYHVIENTDPRLSREATGLVIYAWGGEGEHGMYLDGIEIDVPDDDLCIDLEIRLQHLWGPGDDWTRGNRNANFRRTGLRDPATAVCTLGFYRVPSPDPAHCADDEAPMIAREIDMKHHRLTSQRAIRCELSRDRYPYRPPLYCSFDEKTHTYWLAEENVGTRLCTKAEIANVPKLDRWSVLAIPAE
ncbi:MAG: hypothetical protein QM831_37110 [Kofleriaceae bacterium]